MTELTERGKIFQLAIKSFIQNRREEKLQGNEDGAAKYEYVTWLADAAKRAGATQLVTHPLKATYPDAKIKQATSLFVQGKDLPERSEVGSHCVKYEIVDATGDAASLGVFKFLKETIVEEKNLLYWFLADDQDLLSALDDDPDVARQIANDFKKIDRTSQPPASHFGAKQLYWLTGGNPADNSHYHLLQPLFSSSLAQAIHGEIQDARFGEVNKLARQARRNHESHTGEYRDFQGLVTRKLGGTKPQNISQLNSERGGINYLLASLPPPHWKSKDEIKLRGNSALDAFLRFGSGTVRQLVNQLSDLLLANPDPTMKTRQTREAIEQALGAQLAAFGEAIQEQHAPGWTRTDCGLDKSEQLWLDPKRTELPLREDKVLKQEDVAFNTTYALGDWPDEIAGRFANWLNARLRDAGMPLVGDNEAKHWARLAKHAISDIAWPMQQHKMEGEA